MLRSQGKTIQKSMTEIALITGASSGIGVGIAKVLAAKVLTRHDYSHNQEHIYNLQLLLNYRHHYDFNMKGVTVVLVARREEKLKEVQWEIFRQLAYLKEFSRWLRRSPSVVGRPCSNKLM